MTYKLTIRAHTHRHTHTNTHTHTHTNTHTHTHANRRKELQEMDVNGCLEIIEYGKFGIEIIKKLYNNERPLKYFVKMLTCGFKNSIKVNNLGKFQKEQLLRS